MIGGRPRVILGISGASGSRLGVRALELFSASTEVSEVHLVISPQAVRVAREELDGAIRSEHEVLDWAKLPPESRARVTLYRDGALGAPIASGSFQTLGMAVLPCSAGTLGAVASGVSRGLLQRAADVCLKERRRLVLGLRETPYSAIHAANILAVTQAGAIVAPPVPAFYAARTAEDMLDAYLLRVADLLGIGIATKDYRWKGMS